MILYFTLIFLSILLCQNASDSLNPTSLNGSNASATDQPARGMIPIRKMKPDHGRLKIKKNLDSLHDINAEAPGSEQNKTTQIKPGRKVTRTKRSPDDYNEPNPEIFLQQPKRIQRVLVNSTASFTCSTNYSQAEITWIKDNQNIEEDVHINMSSSHNPDTTKSQLRITNVQKIDEGDYQCIASLNHSIIGSFISGPSTLTIRNKIKITTHPADLTIHPHPGNNVAFQCQSDSDVPLPVQWFRNDKLIETYRVHGHVQVDGSNTFYSESIYPWMDGEYHCVLYSVTDGTIQSSKATLTFNYTLPDCNGANFVIQPIGVYNATENEPYTMECLVYVGRNYRCHEQFWQKDGKKISPGHQHGFWYHIAKVKREDAGIYTCHCTEDNTAFDDVFEDKTTFSSEQLILNVLYSPTVIRLQPPTIMIDHNEISLSVEFRGNPPPNVQWFKYGSLINKSQDKYQITTALIQNETVSSTLQIFSTSESDAGIYQSLAFNSIGSSSSYTRLVLPQDCYDPDVDCYKTNPSCQLPSAFVMDKHVTRSGRLCQKWSDNFPNNLTDNIDIHLMKHNFCRITKGEIVPYCYLMDAIGKETCFRTCSEPADDFNIQYPRKTITVMSGSTFRIECSASNLDDKLQWMRNGEPIYPMRRMLTDLLVFPDGTLEIRNANWVEDGLYQCIATDSTFKMTFYEPIVVRVQFKPKIEVGPFNTNQVQGSIASFQCQPNTDGYQAVQWYKDGILLILGNPGKHRLIEGTNILIVMNISLSDQGKYHCELSSPTGDTLISRSGRLGIAPSWDVEFHIQLFSNDRIGVREGESTTIQCLTNYETTTIQMIWHKDGQRITMNNNNLYMLESGSLRIKSMEKRYHGHYTCSVVVKPSKLCTLRKFFVYLISPMTVISPQPSTITIDKDDVYIDAQVTGNPTVRWFKDGIPLDKSQVTTKSVDTRSISTVTIAAPTATDVGLYQSIWSNNTDFVVMHTLVVERDDDDVVRSILEEQPPANKIVIVDRHTSFKCSVKDLNTEVIWMKDGSRIALHRYKVSISWILGRYVSMLKLYYASTIDNGIYRCMARAPTAGTVMSGPSKLIVRPQTRITRRTTMAINKNATAIIKCKSYIDSGTLAWYKDSIWLYPEGSGNVRLIDGSNTLLIEKVTEQDAGVYYCYASQIMMSGIVTLTVGGANVIGNRPSFVLQPESGTFEVIEGSSRTIGCLANGPPDLPPPSISWYKDGSLVTYTTNVYLIDQGNLRIKAMSKEQQGTYKCVARTDSETGIITIESDDHTLKFMSPPNAVRILQASYPVGRGYVSLETEFVGVPLPTMEWFKDGKLLDGSLNNHKITSNTVGNNARSTLKVTAPNENDVGVYQIISWNKAGSTSMYTRLLSSTTTHISGVITQAPTITTVLASTTEVPTTITKIPTVTIQVSRITSQTTRSATQLRTTTTLTPIDNTQLSAKIGQASSRTAQLPTTSTRIPTDTTQLSANTGHTSSSAAQIPTASRQTPTSTTQLSAKIGHASTSTTRVLTRTTVTQIPTDTIRLSANTSQTPPSATQMSSGTTTGVTKTSPLIAQSSTESGTYPKPTNKTVVTPTVTVVTKEVTDDKLPTMGNSSWPTKPAILIGLATESQEIATEESSSSVTIQPPLSIAQELHQGWIELFVQLESQRRTLNLTFNEMGKKIGVSKTKETGEVMVAVDAAMSSSATRRKRQIPDPLLLALIGYAEKVSDLLDLAQQNAVLNELFVGLITGAIEAAMSDNILKQKIELVKNKAGSDPRQAGSDAALDDITNNNGRETMRIVNALLRGVNAMNSNNDGKTVEDGISHTTIIVVAVLCVVIVLGIVGIIIWKRRRNQVAPVDAVMSRTITTGKSQSQLFEAITGDINTGATQSTSSKTTADGYVKSHDSTTQKTQESSDSCVVEYTQSETENTQSALSQESLRNSLVEHTQSETGNTQSGSAKACRLAHRASTRFAKRPFQSMRASFPNESVCCNSLAEDTQSDTGQMQAPSAKSKPGKFHGIISQKAPESCCDETKATQSEVEETQSASTSDSHKTESTTRNSESDPNNVAAQDG